MQDLPWTSYARWLRERHGAPVRRVAVDAGFGCPHRADGRGPGGCTFCAGGAVSVAGAAAQPRFRGDLEAVRRQLARALERVPGTTALLLFFQAFSGTNAPVEELARIYDATLDLAPFVALDVATRPDCFDARKAELLGSYRARGLDVWVELGLQSSDDRTLRRLHRGHTASDFARAARTAKAAGLGLGVHVILGLPGEGLTEIRETARFLGAAGVDGVKIHNLHVVRGSPLEREMLAGEVTAPGPERQLDDTIAFLEGLDPRVLVMRLVTETPPGRLLAPRRAPGKTAFTRMLDTEMRRRGTRQGRCSSPTLLDPAPRIA
ncbi:MAG: TIGR01212 family radical SAM protein [Spirochaetes bacterium]|nr:TIGR01212 family radical SAM protein [Spirochaetota bacterium]